MDKAMNSEISSHFWQKTLYMLSFKNHTMRWLLALFLIFLAGCTFTSTTNVTLYFQPEPGQYEGGVQVILAATDPAAKIYYRLDSSVPDTNSLLYTGPIYLSETTTLSAIAYKNSLRVSDKTTVLYEITPKSQTAGRNTTQGNEPETPENVLPDDSSSTGGYTGDSSGGGGSNRGGGGDGGSDSGTGGTNIPPTVSLSSPLQGQSYTIGTPIPIIANAADSDGTIERVEIYQNNILLTILNASPYEYQWT